MVTAEDDVLIKSQFIESMHSAHIKSVEIVVVGTEF
jgi:hypothetical protein